MKKRMYWILTHVPIAGSAIKAYTEPYLWNSLALEAAANGEDDGFLRMVSEYARAHPDEQITRQLVERLAWAWNAGKAMASGDLPTEFTWWSASDEPSEGRRGQDNATDPVAEAPKRRRVPDEASMIPSALTESGNTESQEASR